MRFNPLLVTVVFSLSALESAHPSEPSSPKADPNNHNHVIEPKSPALTNKKENDEWRLWYIAKGTCSEGVHGGLCVDGKWIMGHKVGEKVICKLGEFVWHGDWDGRKMTWEKSGWLPKDMSKLYSSWTSKEK